MVIWRPHPAIKVKALGLHWRNGCLLAFDVHDDAGNVKGVRPLGGSVEFGETWQTALVREFREELGIEVAISGEPIVIENIYVHEGSQGHEVMFVSDILFPDGAFMDRDVIEFVEDSGEHCVARWVDIDETGEGGVELYPTALKAHLFSRRHSG